jgi:hypothetical protein
LKIKYKCSKGAASFSIRAETDKEAADLKDVILATVRRNDFTPAAIMEELEKKWEKDNPPGT